VPGERQEDDPFDTDKIRRFKLIRSFLVLMREIKLVQFTKGREYQWPPHITSTRPQRLQGKQAWSAWKKEVRSYANKSMSTLLST
jgi:hypothetical protein